ncbi:hypothetical protein Y032_0098g3115 [Ancylostoma ceylanicum]|uniref:Uncharacterized protein n=1 Tax=Ancylostoma ceylanicum TaxID=53326 RepID=A0A016TJ86_9BILA|nr:hypothetical protein Y032_0098g3115 [Ancylostoma ceylanicum]
MSYAWQRSMAIHVAIDTYHFHDPYLLYRRLIFIHFELAKFGDTLSSFSSKNIPRLRQFKMNKKNRRCTRLGL